MWVHTKAHKLSGKVIKVKWLTCLFGLRQVYMALITLGQRNNKLGHLLFLLVGVGG